jgi:hypothetical protein
VSGKRLALPDWQCKASSKIVLLTASSAGERKKEREKEELLVRISGLVQDEHTALVVKGTIQSTD